MNNPQLVTTTGAVPIKLVPPSVLLQGESGAGKTSSIITLVAAGIETFVIGTEPGFIDSLIDRCRELQLNMSKLHWMSVLPATEGWEAIDEVAHRIGTLDFEGLAKIKGIGKDQTRIPNMKFLNALKNFVCERDGKEYGSYTQWDDSRALVIDSLSGLSTIAWYLTVGYKPTGAPGEWNTSMNYLEMLLMKINSDRKCYFVLTAHVEKEMDEILGVNRIMVSTLGRKLAPKVPRFFSEVVYAQRTTTEPRFRWSTIDANAALKNRVLPIGAVLSPNFGPVVAGHINRKKLAST